MSLTEPVIEHLMVKKLLKEEHFLAAITRHLEPKYLTDASHRKTYEYVSKFYDKRGKIPNPTELNLEYGTEALIALKESLDKLKGLDEVDPTMFIQSTNDFIKKKATEHAIKELVSLYREGKADAGLVMTKFESITSICLEENLGIEVFRDIEKVEKAMRLESERISTGWPWLDRALRGGWRKDGKSLYLFMGAANVGKSIWLGNCATNMVKAGKNVLLISFEMSEMLYSERLVSGITQIKISDLKTSQEGKITEAVTAYKDNNKVGKLFIKEFPPSTISVPEIKAFIQKLIRSGERIDAVVLDYINLIRGNETVGSYERIKDVAEKLRALTYVFNIPFITATQIGRGKNKGYGTDAPELDDVSESIGLIQTVDGAFGIWQEEGDQELGNMNLNIIKSREGIRNIRSTFKIDYSTLTIRDDAYTRMATAKTSVGDMMSKIAENNQRR